MVPIENQEGIQILHYQHGQKCVPGERLRGALGRAEEVAGAGEEVAAPPRCCRGSL
jgi:hypothetical protein